MTNTYISNPHPNLAIDARCDQLAWLNDGFVVNDQHELVNPNHPELIKQHYLPEALMQKKITPRMIILHTQAGKGKASNDQLFNWCLIGTNLEPHIIGPEMDSGAMLQAIPFNVRADSSAAANGFLYNGIYYGALSAETQDLGDATVDKTTWTWPQIRSLVGWMTACCAAYTISCGDVAYPQGSGIAPHNRWPGWTQSGHSCPGKARTSQMDGLRGAVAERLAKYYEVAGLSCPGT